MIPTSIPSATRAGAGALVGSWCSGAGAIQAQHTLAASLSTAGIAARSRIRDLGVGWVEDLRRWYPSPDKEEERYSRDFKVAFPYRGIFVWHIGTADVVGDANQVLFVRPGEGFRVSGPSATRISGELIITPAVEVLAEIAGTRERDLFEHGLFSRRAVRATAGVQFACARFLHQGMTEATAESLDAQEKLLALMRAAIQPDLIPPRGISNAARHLVSRTKTVLSERFTERLRLPEIARSVGASPTYLTDLFTRSEGTSLHQYLTQLRLSRALVDLPHAHDLTALALDLGFSSHSHFTFAFRRLFGCTPSAFRESTRKQLAAAVRQAAVRAARLKSASGPTDTAVRS